MRINNIKMTGFKGYEKEINYRFDNLYTLISGPNGAGKTSIAEGVIWCLYGCNLWGNDKVDSILLNKNSTEMMIEVEIEVEGIVHTITRTKKKSVTVKLDCAKITQKALEDILPNKELFLSVFNPKYFLGLTPSKARARLIDMLPAIDPLQVLEKFNAWDKMPVISKYKDDINGGIKELNKKLKETKEQLNVLTGEKNTYIQLKSDVESRIRDMGEVISISDEEMKLITNLENIISIERSKRFIGLSANEIQLKLELLNSKYRELKNNRYKSDSDTSINEMELELASMRGQYRILAQNLESAKTLGNQCNCCGQAIPQEFKLKQIKIVEVEIENLKIAANEYKNSIDFIKQMEKGKEAEFEGDKREKLLALGSEIKALQEELRLLDETNIINKKEFLEVQESAINDYVIQLDSLIAKRQVCASLSSELNINKSNLNKYNEMLQFTYEKLKSIDEKITEITNEKNVLVKYNAHYVDLVGILVEMYLTEIKINLYKVNNESGEIKEDFYITYKGKEYSLLSNSERIRVGLDIANMFNELLSVEYPTFVDDSESILELPKINTQMIICKVSDIKEINIL